MAVKRRLAVNPIACTGHGLCADMMPEWISRDEWGYPIVASRELPGGLTALARRTVRLCPTLALRLEAMPAAPAGAPAAAPSGSGGKGVNGTNPASANHRPGHNKAGRNERAVVRK